MGGVAKHRQRVWIAVVLALAFLGHDVLMAGDTRAMPMPDAHAAGRGHRGADMHSVIIRFRVPVAFGRLDVASEAHMGGCATTRRAVPNSGDDPGLSVVSPGIVSVAPAALLALPMCAWWREPSAPPGVRRAFSQVYRI